MTPAAFFARRAALMGGAFGLGWLQKQGVQLPKLPVLGETGTIGLAALLVGGPLAVPIATAALAIAAFQLGSTGNVVGPNEGC